MGMLGLNKNLRVETIHLLPFAITLLSAFWYCLDKCYDDQEPLSSARFFFLQEYVGAPDKEQNQTLPISNDRVLKNKLVNSRALFACLVSVSARGGASRKKGVMGEETRRRSKVGWLRRSGVDEAVLFFSSDAYLDVW